MTDQPRPARKKAHVQTEEIKQQHVSHWDLDYLPREQIDDAMTQEPPSDQEEEGDK